MNLWDPNCSWVTHKATKFIKVWRFKVKLIHPLWQPSWWLNDNCKTRYYIETDKKSRNLTQVVQCQIKEVFHNSAFPLCFNPKHVFGVHEPTLIFVDEWVTGRHVTWDYLSPEEYHCLLCHDLRTYITQLYKLSFNRIGTTNYFCQFRI